MLRYSAQAVARATQAELVLDGAHTIENVVIDSREVRAGSLFVCFKGERVDGNRYARAAVEAGAAAVALTADAASVAEDLVALARKHGCALLRAAGDDALEFLRSLAEAWRLANDQWVVVGVTGSVGKTTTKDMLAAGLSSAGDVYATPANLNTLIGCSLTLLSASATDRFVVCEMGVDHPGDMDPLVRTAHPNLAVITNVGTSHLGNFGSREAIAREKAQIATGMAQAPGAVAPCLAITADNDFADLIQTEFAQAEGVQLLRVGTASGCDVRSTGLTLDEDSRPHFALEVAGQHVADVALDALGTHVVADFLLAMGVCWKAGLDLAAAAKAVEHMKRTALRMEVKRAPGCPRVIDDSYNASPSSMAAALDVLASMRCTGRRVAVLGEIGELGEDAPRLHALVGAYAAAKGLDLVVFVGEENVVHMVDAARTMGLSEDRLEVFPSGAAALEVLKGVFGEDDLMLVKASRFMGLDAFAKGVLA